MTEPAGTGKRRLRSRLRSIVDRADDERERGQSSLRRGIFLLPNLITTGALFAGFYAMVAAMKGSVVAAALATYAAMVLDAADGRVARLTRTQSAFGAEYDSLSDMVAFGVAPALIAFSWALSQLGQLGWVVTFVYMACAALRLARYNTSGDISHFTGLASPAAACVVVSSVWVLNESGSSIGPGFTAGALAAVTITAAILMVSNFRYFSPKVFTFRGRVPFTMLVVVVLVFAAVLSDPPHILLVLFGVYALSGPAQWLWRKKGSRHSD